MSDKVLMELINKYGKLLTFYQLLCELVMQIDEINKDEKVRKLIDDFDTHYGIGKQIDFYLKGDYK